MAKKKSKLSRVPTPPPAPSPPSPSPPPLRKKLDPVVLTQQDLCDLLKISRTTLYRMEKDFFIPGRVVLGGSVRYYRDQVFSWVESGCPHE
jgi:predicted DNA-binding transcriptional regulator AlpA